MAKTVGGADLRAERKPGAQLFTFKMPVGHPSGNGKLAVGSTGLEFQQREVWTRAEWYQNVECLNVDSGGCQLLVMTRYRLKQGK